MNLLHLRYFAELARTQHFTHAAERLCITQPSLSHAIRQLEAELGVPLFERAGRTTTLTCFGEQFLACTQKTLTTLDEGVDELRRAARGEGLIRLGLLRTLGVDFVPGLAARFLQENPERDFRFTFHTGVTQGFGISVVPYMEMLLRLDVKILSIRRPVLERNFYLVSNDNVYMPPAVQRFRQYVLHSSRLRPDAGFTE